MIIIEIKCTINVICLNRPEISTPHPTPWSMGNLSSKNPLSGAKQVEFSYATIVLGTWKCVFI